MKATTNHHAVSKTRLDDTFVIMPTRKKPATRVVNIRLTEGDLKTIDAIAKRESRTRANLLVALIRQALTTRSAKVKDMH